jgi:hypothetical protein
MKRLFFNTQKLSCSPTKTPLPQGDGWGEGAHTPILFPVNPLFPKNSVELSNQNDYIAIS